MKTVNIANQFVEICRLQQDRRIATMGTMKHMMVVQIVSFRVTPIVWFASRALVFLAIQVGN